MVGARPRDPEAQLAVIKQQIGADAGSGENFGMWQLHPQRVAGDRAEIEAEALPGLQLHAPAGKPADPQLGALHIGENADMAVEFLFEVTDHGDASGVIVMRAMAEIQPEHVCSRLKQPRQHLRRRTGWPQRGDDLGAAAAADFDARCHYSSPRTRMARISLTLVSVGPVRMRSEMASNRL